ncbi:MAG: tRNA (N6-isopentenyl adenosine(37)-C2)-methylthiotransferase MiaB [Desulfococcaceae bacterium]
MNDMTSRGLYIQTMGCQMNVYDSGRIAALMSPLGFHAAEAAEEADLIVVNTCAIREKAEQKAFSLLGRLAEIKRRRPEVVIAAGGCVAQRAGKEILRRAPCVDIVFGTHAVARLPQMVRDVEDRRCRVVDVEMGDRYEECELPGGFGADGGVSRFVTIMQGCDNFCTYCVVPFARGREASRRPERILAEVRTLVENGVREVTLLGQNVNSYGRKEGLPGFPELLARVAAVPGLERVRFTTSHPKDLSPALADAFGALEGLCPHLHLPVQSGSDRVLKRMNRRYTRDDYLEKVRWLRAARPDINLTTDIIVGFPGETEADFQATLELVREVDFGGLFAFVYSDRPGAPAARFGDKVPESEGRARLQTLLSLQEAATRRKNEALVGTRVNVLVEGRGRPAPGGDGERPWTGRTPGNAIVHMPFLLEGPWADRDLMGETVPVQVETALAHSLQGRPRVLTKGDACHAA